MSEVKEIVKVQEDFIPITLSNKLVDALVKNSHIQIFESKGLEVINHRGINYDYLHYNIELKKHFFIRTEKSKENFGIESVTTKINVGDILWVKESWQHTSIAINLGLDDDNSGYIYKASQNGKDWEDNVEEWTWKSPVSMPKEACRLFIKCTSISVEKLKEPNSKRLNEYFFIYNFEIMDNTGI